MVQQVRLSAPVDSCCSPPSLAMAKKAFSTSVHVPGHPKRTRIGNGLRVRNRVWTGRTKRSSPRKVYGGQGR